MKWFWRIGRIAGLSYVGVSLVLMWFENYLVYRPVRAQEDWEPPPSAEIEDISLTTAAGTRIHAWWLACPDSDQAVLYCHGNAGNLSHRGWSIVKLREIFKTSVLIFDYPGYGKSDGRPSEQGCYAAAVACYDYLTDAQHIDPSKIMIYGGSLGGGVAVDLASRKPHRALILAKTFTCAPDTGAAMFPWLPVRWLMCNRYDNVTKIKQCTRPVFIAHGTADTLIPFSQGKRLFEAANEPKQFLALDGANHNDPLPREFFEALKRFLDKNP